MNDIFNNKTDTDIRKEVLSQDKLDMFDQPLEVGDEVGCTRGGRGKQHGPFTATVNGFTVREGRLAVLLTKHSNDRRATCFAKNVVRLLATGRAGRA